jgi:hypothetical protein
MLGLICFMLGLICFNLKNKREKLQSHHITMQNLRIKIFDLYLKRERVECINVGYKQLHFHFKFFLNSIELDSFEFFQMKNKWNLKFYSILNLILHLNICLFCFNLD